MLEILEIANAVPEPVEPVPVEPVPAGAGGAVEVEPDIFEMKSAAKEHQRQCHKSARWKPRPTSSRAAPSDVHHRVQADLERGGERPQFRGDRSV